MRKVEFTPYQLKIWDVSFINRTKKLFNRLVQPYMLFNSIGRHLDCALNLYVNLTQSSAIGDLNVKPSTKGIRYLYNLRIKSKSVPDSRKSVIASPCRLEIKKRDADAYFPVFPRQTIRNRHCKQLSRGHIEPRRPKN